ncbi:MULTISPECIES: LTA synthase family protein [Clostridium]|uniref:LTA synthase family protein n=1 Tax=Clostridium TaxID=1485 RepID=UPI000403B709|nr:LTA synthase family protein [Clostridium cadaveris]MDU4952642.1 LTA synthase family protein [Clostridium sp.]NME65087.1 LTA synthase family protein [Clostridium cadaveris]NWK12301.1 LTA synthase family protein [Clostridium cadaveris]UFH65742.1 LTA synthase family protein [Clostridium cadaveris]
MTKFNLKEWFKKRDKLFLIVGFLIWLKTLMFLALIHGKDSATFNIARMYFSPPPFICHILFVVIIMAIGLCFKGRGRLAYYIIINLFVSMLLWADLVYYREYGGFLTVEYLFHPGSFNPGDVNLFKHIHLVDILFFIDIIVLLVIAIKYKEYYRGRFKSLGKNILTSAVLIVLSVAYIYGAHIYIDVKDKTNGDMLFFKTTWAPFQTMSNTSPLGYHAFDIYNHFVANKVKDLSKDDMKAIDEWYKENDENLPDNKYKGILKGKNVIFLQVESLESFVINETVDGQEITPNINKMLNNSYYFNNIYDNVNNGTSADGDLISNTSLYPVRQGATYFRYAFNKYNSLANILESENYKTISVHPERSGNWNWRTNHKNFGFETTYDINDYKLDEIIGPGLSDGSFFKQTVDFIKDEKTPFFLHAATLTSHGPFDIPDNKKELNLSDNIKDTILGAYFQSIRYVDNEIGNLVKYLNDNKLMNNTVLVIYGDHSGPHKFYQDKIEAINGIKEQWKSPEKKVPFIIYNPSINGEIRDVIGGQVDMMPTVLYALGVEKDKYINTVMGRNLLNTKRNFTVLNFGEIVGNPNTKEEEQHIKNAIPIANKIIEGNYFKVKDE